MSDEDYIKDNAVLNFKIEKCYILMRRNKCKARGYSLETLAIL